MGLKPYHKKRNFKKTPEPKGKIGRKLTSKKLFIIQKHAASHLHYDFRLELNGVLLSWAVPKGPSLDPSVKRLAIHVEDHPIEYGGFEGIIPKGQYGGGTVMLWDKGEWISENENPEAAYKKGDLKFILKGKKLKGLWKLIRIRGDDKTWLLIKGKDKYAKPASEYDITVKAPKSVISKKNMDEIAESTEREWGPKGEKKIVKKKLPKKIKLDLASSRFPTRISPELATLVDKPPVGPHWVHEIKFDGYRLIAFKKDKSASLFTRHQLNWTNKFMPVSHEISQLPYSHLILDGEIVVLDHNHHSNFQLLQNAIKENNSENFVYYVFDLLYIDQYNLTSLPLIERKKILGKIIPKDNPTLRYSDHVTGDGKTVFEKSCALGLEGIISKDAKSPYFQRRTKDWLKIKCHRRQEFIIGGFTKPKNSRSHFGSLLLGAYNKQGQLIYHGNVGTGFTQASLREVYQALSKLKSSEMPFIETPPGSRGTTWVKPKLVAEIEFSEWTQDNYLRHPSFKGLRTDKKPNMIVKESTVPVKTLSSARRSQKILPKKESDLKITNPNKILYPEGKITKGEVIEYYETIQDWILPYVTNRLLTLVRCPEGYQHCFYQKHLHKETSPALYQVPIKEKNGVENYIFIKNSTGLLLLPQMGTLEIHPWGSQVKKVEYPDILIFDLDPAPNIAWKKVVEAAFEVKQHLKDFKLQSFVKTTGGKGLHIVVPIMPQYQWDEIKNFTHVFVDFLVLKHPNLYISKMSKAARQGKIFIDYLRNQRGATAVAPYSTRARKYAPVATPIHWDELTHNIKDTFFTLKTIPERLNSLKKDPWKDFFKLKQKLNLDKYK